MITNIFVFAFTSTLYLHSLQACKRKHVETMKPAKKSFISDVRWQISDVTRHIGKFKIIMMSSQIKIYYMKLYVISNKDLCKIICYIK